MASHQRATRHPLEPSAGRGDQGHGAELRLGGRGCLVQDAPSVAGVFPPHRPGCLVGLFLGGRNDGQRAGKWPACDRGAGPGQRRKYRSGAGARCVFHRPAALAAGLVHRPDRGRGARVRGLGCDCDPTAHPPRARDRTRQAALLHEHLSRDQDAAQPHPRPGGGTAAARPGSAAAPVSVADQGQQRAPARPRQSAARLSQTPTRQTGLPSGALRLPVVHSAVHRRLRIERKRAWRDPERGKSAAGARLPI